MAERKAGKADDQGQLNRFVEAAKSLGADEDDVAFRARLAVIARQKPKDAPAEPPKAVKGKKAG